MKNCLYKINEKNIVQSNNEFQLKYIEEFNFFIHLTCLFEIVATILFKSIKDEI